MPKRRILWDKAALHYFSQAIGYIRKDSEKNAGKVKNEILARIRELSSRPEIHPADKYKRNNAGQYRAFELHRYRVAYLVKEDQIIITRVRHTSQEPQDY